MNLELIYLVGSYAYGYWRALFPDARLYKLPLFTSNRFVRVIMEQLCCWWVAWKLKAYVYYSFSSGLPILPKSCKKVVYFQNLLFFHFNEFYSREKLDASWIEWMLRYWLWNRYSLFCGRNAFRRADVVIAVSEQMAAELRAKTGRYREKPIHIIANGISEIYFKRENRASPVEGSYLLSVSSILPHKNYEAAIRIFAKYRAAHGISQKLYIIGKGPNRYLERLKDLAQNQNVGKHVHFLGPMDNEAIRRWYAHADAFLLTSLCESLGLPLVEAMAQKTVVICSEKSGLSNTVGEFGVLADPDDEEAFAERLYELLSDGSMKNALIDKASHYAQSYRWATAARRTLDLFLSI